MDVPLLPVLPGYDNPQLIAHGTTALVFRARQTRLNRLVAIKVITADTGSVPVNAARELATTVSLSSQPHIVSIIDTGTTADDRPYIVMEYCEGGSYAQILRREGPVPVADVIEVGVKIGEALHAAHQAGIVHRDVKPSNILRSRFGPALTDFGIARAPDELSGTLTREMMTPHHASPEALLHQAQSGLSDVYSLASTLWTLLVGHPPFVDPTQPALDMYAFRDKVLHDSVPPVPRDDVPAWLGGELIRGMAKLPAHRHGSALEFAEALRRGDLGLPSAASRIPGDSRPTLVHRSGLPPQAWPVTTPSGAVAPAGTATPADAPAAHAEEDAAVYIPPARAASGVRMAPSGAPSPSPAAASPAVAGASPPAVGSAPPTRSPAVGSTAAARSAAGSSPARSAAVGSAPARSAAVGSAPARSPAVGSAPAARLTAVGSAPAAWLAAPPARPSAADWPPASYSAATISPAEPVTSQPHPPRFGTQRFDEHDLMPPSRTGTRILIALVGVAVAAVATAAAITLARESPQHVAAAPTSPVATSAVLAAAPPRDVKITDRGTSLVLSWSDPSHGNVSFVVVTGSHGQPLPARQVEQGVTTVSYTGLDAAKAYCFRVGAIYSYRDVQVTPEVCTHRR